jgi:hypothetical protein
MMLKDHETKKKGRTSEIYNAKKLRNKHHKGEKA